MKALGVALGVGALAAFAIACGSAQHASMPPTVADSSSSPVPAGAQGDRHAEIAALDQQIVDEMAKLDLPVQTPLSAGCPPGTTCTAATMAAGIELPEQDPTCTPGKTVVCKDSCTFADSICTNADKICTIAGELGGTDSFANDKCESAKTSCTSSSTRCCSCM